MDIRAKLFCSVFLFANLVHAEGFYILGSIGQSHTELKDISKSDMDSAFDDAAQNIGWSLASSKLDDSDTGYKLQLGYQFAPNFALEGGYVDLGKTEYKFTLTDGVDQGSGKLAYESKGWNIDAVLMIPVNAGVTFFGKLGLIRAETELNGTGVGSDTTTKTAPSLGAGLSWNFYQGLSARAEWERYFKLGDEDDVGAELDVDLFSVGLSYQF